ncbi:carbohydrate-binding protein [Bacteroidia bacterium]|nr:carbohydrate-binding protein [Bacteroidia bacterium]
MKINFKNICLAAALAIVAGFSSCSDFMDLKPADQYTEDDFFKSAGLTQGMINKIYSYIVDGSREHVTTGLTDDAYFTHNYGQIDVNEANVSESDLRWYGDNNCPFQWRNAYMGIYYANLVLEKIGSVPHDDDYDLDVLKGETLFLRAYLYSNLIRGFGGVPIIDRTYGLDDAQAVSNIPRSDMGKCLDFILKDLVEAEKLLKPTAALGRATSGAATALKARVMLHVASPLYADRTVNTLDVNQYKGDRNKLYQDALDAAKSVIESGTYQLVECNGISVYDKADKYHAIAISNNTEMIFTKQFASSKVVNNLPLQHGPNGYHNWSGTTPTQDFVVHFEMEDGSLSGSDGLSKPGEFRVGNPYLGREPRFYANIGFDGSVWGRKRPSDAYPLDPTPLGELQCGAYEISDGVSVTVNIPEVGKKVEFTGVYGIDTRQGPIEDWNGSWTSYYEKKLVDTSVDGQNFPQVVPYPHIRLAEMYLIAAEAAIELEKLEEAVTYLNPIRARIFLPDVQTALAKRGQSFNQEDMRKFLRQERRSELSFEDSRYYDVRRWMIAPETNSKTLTGMTVFGLLKDGKKATKRPYIHNEDTWEYHYYVRDLSGSFPEANGIPASVSREKRKWNDKMYFAPISRDEIKRNTTLVQNPGMN